MDIKICSCCGLMVPPKIHMPEVKQRIYDAIRLHRSITRRQLMDKVYWDRRDGGPLWDNVLAVHIKQITNAGCARTVSRSRAPAALAQPIRSNPMQPKLIKLWIGMNV